MRLISKVKLFLTQSVDVMVVIATQVFPFSHLHWLFLDSDTPSKKINQVFEMLVIKMEREAGRIPIQNQNLPVQYPPQLK
jgi:hypothetical protein